MTMPTTVSEAYVHNKRLVRPGDQVNLLTVDLREKDEDGDDFFAQRDFYFMIDWLGYGPFTISWIGRWPCGQIMLYLKGGDADGAGAYASDFM